MQLLRRVRRGVHGHAAGPKGASTEATPAQTHRRVDSGRTKATVGRRPLQKPDVARDPSERGQVHRDAFELESNGARDLHFEVQVNARKALERGAISPSVRDARIAGDGLDERREAARVASEQERLQSAVLVSELDLQMVNLFAEAHESKRAGLDDPRVNRAHGDFVHLLSLDPVEGIVVHGGLGLTLVSDGLEPWVRRHAHARLLVQFSLEAVKGREFGRHLVVSHFGARHGPRQKKRSVRCLEHRRDRYAPLVSPAKEGDDAVSFADLGRQMVSPRLRIEDLRFCDALPVDEDRRGHGSPSEAATCRRSPLTPSGM